MTHDKMNPSPQQATYATMPPASQLWYIVGVDVGGDDKETTERAIIAMQEEQRKVQEVDIETLQHRAEFELDSDRHGT